MTTNPSPDAVEVVKSALARTDAEWDGLDVLEFMQALKEKGFTITRQPAMTDAELEREAENLASDFQAGSYSESDWGAEIFELVKKCRG